MNKNRSIKEIRLKNLVKARIKLKKSKIEELSKLSKVIFSDFAYVLGVILGDGYITLPKNGGGYIGLNVKDEDFAEAFKKSLDEWSGKKCRLYFYRDFWRVYLHSVAVAKFLNNFNINKLLSFSEEIKCAFLKGLFDSEGSLHYKQKRIRFYNSDNNLINLTKIILESLGINHIKIYKRKEEIHILHGRKFLVKPVYSLAICRRKNIQLFYDKIGFSIKKKQEKLEEILNSYQRNHLFWTKEELEYLKNNSHKNYHKIAERMKRNVNSVRRTLYRYGLKPKVDNRLLV